MFPSKSFTAVPFASLNKNSSLQFKGGGFPNRRKSELCEGVLRCSQVLLGTLRLPQLQFLAVC